MASETDAGRYLIHKAGRGWYRPDAQGYTLDPRQAGRYSFDEAVAHSHPNGPFGPRDGITVKNESEVDGACPAPEYAGLVEQDEYDIAAAATNHADKVLRAAGSALKHYTTLSVKKAILSAMLDAIEEAYRAGADLVIARTSDLTERNKALEAEVERLREAAAAVLHDWHSDTGFVESVRLTTGRPWPWCHGEKSVADLRAALGARP